MKPPIFVRELSEKERESLQAGLRSRDTFVMRRCQILLKTTRVRFKDSTKDINNV
jgi:hypothetical protein